MYRHIYHRRAGMLSNYTRSVAKSPGNINTKMGMIVVVLVVPTFECRRTTQRRKKTFYLLTECQQIHVNKDGVVKVNV